MMSKKPWFKFNPTDWRDDEALRMCSIGARGLWIELLCIMDRAEPRGHLLVKGKRPSVAQIAKLAAVELELCEPLLRELADHEVFHRTQDGTIISRKMVRDTRISTAGRDAVEKRWGPENAQDFFEPNGGLTYARDQSSDSQSPDVQRTEIQRGRGRGRAETPIPEGFPDERALKWATERIDAEHVQVNLGREVAKFRDHNLAKDKRFKDWHAAWRTWINNTISWALDDGKVVPFEPREMTPEAEDRVHRLMMESWLADGTFPPSWPKPDAPGCPVPLRIMSEYGYAPGAEVTQEMRLAARRRQRSQA